MEKKKLNSFYTEKVTLQKILEKHLKHQNKGKYMQNVLTLETNKYKVKVENFEGPLDLLCHLIDKNKMDICDIKISEITDQYIAYLNAMEELNLEIASEFLIMASTLLYLKSKTLLPMMLRMKRINRRGTFKKDYRVQEI